MPAPESVVIDLTEIAVCRQRGHVEGGTIVKSADGDRLDINSGILLETDSGEHVHEVEPHRRLVAHEAGRRCRNHEVDMLGHVALADCVGEGWRNAIGRDGGGCRCRGDGEPARIPPLPTVGEADVRIGEPHLLGGAVGHARRGSPGPRVEEPGGGRCIGGIHVVGPRLEGYVGGGRGHVAPFVDARRLRIAGNVCGVCGVARK